MRYQRREFLQTAATAGGFLAANTAPPLAAAAEQVAGHKTDWLHETRWGVMYHYVSAFHGVINEEDEWQQAVKSFDVPGLADELQSAGAGYFSITARHVGLPLAPHRGYREGKFPARDMIADLAEELSGRDISMMLYFACGGATRAAASSTVGCSGTC